MSDTTSPSGYTDYERELLGTYFSVVDGPEHADIYLVHNLPAEVAALVVSHVFLGGPAQPPGVCI